MNTQPYADQVPATSTRNGTAQQSPLRFPVGGEEPEAMRSRPEIATQPVAPTKRAKASRRRYPLEEKRRILRLVDACTQRGQLGALLRREGLYYSTLRVFQEQRDKGLLDEGVRSAKKSKQDQTLALTSQVAELQRENKRLANQLEKAEIVIDFQKKLSRLLALDSQEPTL
jgi:transposase